MPITPTYNILFADWVGDGVQVSLEVLCPFCSHPGSESPVKESRFASTWREIVRFDGVFHCPACNKDFFYPVPERTAGDFCLEWRRSLGEKNENRQSHEEEQRRIISKEARDCFYADSHRGTRKAERKPKLRKKCSNRPPEVLLKEEFGV